MHNNRLFDTFSALVSIDSPSLSERDMFEYLAGRLAELGFAVHEDDVGNRLGGKCGNLYGYLEGGEGLEPLLLSAHMDTVEPSRGKKAVFHTDGKITSAGDTVLGADDCAGIAAILEAVQRIREQNLPHRPIEVLFTVAEEIYGKGSALFDYSRLQSKEAYVLDLTGAVGTAAYQAPSILSFAATVTGKASHAGFAPEEGVHAVAVAARAIGTLQMGRVDAETTCNIGLIEGGTALNIVPDHCTVSGEIRSYSHQKALEQAKHVEQAFDEAAVEFGASVDFKMVCHMEAYQTNREHPVALRFKAACDSLGLPFELVSTFGGSDNNHFAKHSIPGLVIACAMNNCHSLAEYTTVEELERVVRLVMALIVS